MLDAENLLGGDQLSVQISISILEKAWLLAKDPYKWHKDPLQAISESGPTHAYADNVGRLGLLCIVARACWVIDDSFRERICSYAMIGLEKFVAKHGRNPDHSECIGLLDYWIDNAVVHLCTLKRVP
jgi:hypothetical protein